MKKSLLAFVFLGGYLSANAIQQNNNPVNDRTILSEIVYVEEIDEVELGFDPQKYLPRGFNPFEKYFNIHSVNFVEQEPEVYFNFTVEDYLPRGFKAGEIYFDFLAIPYINDFDEEEFYQELMFFIKKNAVKNSK